MQNTGIKPIVLKEIRKAAEENGIEKIILYGSRARGDYKRTSDIDLAVCGGNTAKFAMEIEESTSTLLEYDVVDLGRPVQQELLESIQKEGVVLYEKI